MTLPCADTSQQRKRDAPGVAVSGSREEANPAEVTLQQQQLSRAHDNSPAAENLRPLAPTICEISPAPADREPRSQDYDAAACCARVFAAL